MRTRSRKAVRPVGGLCMRVFTGPKIFVALLAFVGIGVILTLDPSAVLEQHRQAALERSQQYQDEYTAAYSHFMRSGAQPASGAADPSQAVGSLAFYYYPAFRHPTDATIAASQAGEAMEQFPAAAGQDAAGRQIEQLKLQMYQHANREEYEQAAKLKLQIQALEEQ